ncbi:MAG: serine/threonine-protein phosphatase [Planctomycetes bacterium]|nr:serine/threonine-protein phosphatase [Planctomycetota bacterium]
MHSHQRASRDNGLPEEIAHALEHDPAFRVHTMDATGWIDPYTAQVVPTPFGMQEVAKTHLIRTRPWLKLQAKPLKELLYVRWLNYLRDNIEFVPALRVFRNGLWLNPYNGQWVSGIQLDNHQVTKRVADDLAKILAACPEAQTGRMLEKWQIETLTAQGPARSAAPEVQEMVRASGRVARAKTDFHSIRQGFLKMLHRPPRMQGHQLVVHFEPHAQISRDFYDFIDLGGGKLLLVVGDFTGIGPGAALMAGTALQVLRKIAPGHKDLVELLSNLNDELRIDLLHGCSIAIFAILLDTATNRLSCLSAGHQPALLVRPRRDNTLTRIRTPGASLGALTGPDFRKTLVPLNLQLEPGDILLIHSNGLAHAANAHDPDAGRWSVMGQCVANIKRPCAELVARVVEETKRSSDKLPDDITVLALRIKDESWLLESKE